jgi:hypothetical protein
MDQQSLPSEEGGGRGEGVENAPQSPQHPLSHSSLSEQIRLQREREAAHHSATDSNHSRNVATTGTSVPNNDGNPLNIPQLGSGESQGTPWAGQNSSSATTTTPPSADGPPSNGHHSSNGPWTPSRISRAPGGNYAPVPMQLDYGPIEEGGGAGSGGFGSGFFSSDSFGFGSLFSGFFGGGFGVVVEGGENGDAAINTAGENDEFDGESSQGLLLPDDHPPQRRQPQPYQQYYFPHPQHHINFRALGVYNSEEYRATAYFYMMVMDLYYWFRSLPLPAQAFLIALLMWITWKLF